MTINNRLKTFVNFVRCSIVKTCLFIVPSIAARSGTWSSGNSTNSFVKTTVKAITMVLSICNSPSPLTPQNATAVMMTNTNSVRNIINYCSRGIVRFHADVVPFEIKIPCPETTLSQNCNVHQWAESADQLVRSGYQTHNTYDTYTTYNLDAYNYRIYILPEGCPFAGLGNVGPCTSSTCRIWSSGPYAARPEIYVHELGHNFGLHHARYKEADYGDGSSAMGYCCVGCYTAPHTNLLRWTNPVAQFDVQLSPPKSFRLKANEYITVNDTWCYQMWFVQYRVGHSVYDTVKTNFDNSINVYIMNSNMGTVNKGVVRTQSERFIADNFQITLVSQPNRRYVDFDIRSKPYSGCNLMYVY